MRTRVMVLTLGALLVSMLGVGWAPPVLAGPEPRHAGQVEAVDVQNRLLTLSELAEGGTMRTLHVRISPQATVVRSQPLPANQVTDLARPFKDSAISLSDIRPGDFVVVELFGTGKKAEASSVTVTFERGSTTGEPSQATVR